MTGPPALVLDHVAKSFRRRSYRPTTLKTALLERLRRRRSFAAERFDALHDVELTVQAGRSVGIIGRNGSGKSTLLKVIAGIYRPDRGTVRVHGRVAALIELGAGFHPEFSGRENVFINGMVLGLSRRQIAARLDEIVAFSGLGDFIDAPARTYSSGMYMRLGFSVAVHLDPDVLLVDEVLAVGDEEFQKRCYDRIAELRERGKTMVLVTHDPGAVERWCDEAVWLDRGTVRVVGTPRKVIDLYHQAIDRGESDALAEAYAAPPPSGQRWGTREIEIVRVRLLDAAGLERYVYETGEPVTVSFTYRVHRDPGGPYVFGFAVSRADGVCVYGTNTHVVGADVPALGAGGEAVVMIEHLDLVGGGYFLDVAVHSADGVPYDYHGRRYPFSVRSVAGELGFARIRHRWRIDPA